LVERTAVWRGVRRFDLGVVQTNEEGLKGQVIARSQGKKKHPATKKRNAGFLQGGATVK